MMKLISRWIQTYKSLKLKKEKNVRVFIYIKKSSVKFKEGNAILIEYVLPSGVFLIFADGKYYNDLKTSHGNIISVLEEINGVDSQLFSLIKEDGKFSLNGNLITILDEHTS